MTQDIRMHPYKSHFVNYVGFAFDPTDPDYQLAADDRFQTELDDLDVISGEAFTTNGKADLNKFISRHFEEMPKLYQDVATDKSACFRHGNKDLCSSIHFAWRNNSKLSRVKSPKQLGATYLALTGKDINWAASKCRNYRNPTFISTCLSQNEEFRKLWLHREMQSLIEHSEQLVSSVFIAEDHCEARQLITEFSSEHNPWSQLLALTGTREDLVELIVLTKAVMHDYKSGENAGVDNFVVKSCWLIGYLLNSVPAFFNLINNQEWICGIEGFEFLHHDNINWIRLHDSRQLSLIATRNRLKHIESLTSNALVQSDGAYSLNNPWAALLKANSIMTNGSDGYGTILVNALSEMKRTMMRIVTMTINHFDKSKSTMESTISKNVNDKDRALSAFRGLHSRISWLHKNLIELDKFDAPKNIPLTNSRLLIDAFLLIDDYFEVRMAYMPCLAAASRSPGSVINAIGMNSSEQTEYPLPEQEEDFIDGIYAASLACRSLSEHIEGYIQRVKELTLAINFPDHHYEAGSGEDYEEALVVGATKYELTSLRRKVKNLTKENNAHSERIRSLESEIKLLKGESKIFH